MAFKVATPIKAARQKLYEVVLENLTEQIISQELSPGDVLPSEAELAEAYGVSKTTVHDALRHLSVFGVVNMRQGRQTTVGTPRAEVLSQFFRFVSGNVKRNVIDIVDIRRILESGCAGLAAQNISDEQCEELSEIIDTLFESRYDKEAWIKQDAAFHHLIAKASGNQMMPYLMTSLQGVIEDTIRVLHDQRNVRDPDQTFKRHKMVADAIISRDSEAAIAAMEVHFRATAATIERIQSDLDDTPTKA
ncbi:GntR family transcriptional repressor for pyruvate dehydrogenase complex [Aliiruegeria haliotis]|uniref:GntR family transcriptional repressor for pyruvate dehydrogenase complex n=1 Tax=Aliiruegeria haliotis TaxID=1280846 RepID=A0A2T0RDS5_9RHOB|nr:FadR/GntR family transcriptional regulator [Aliiruegeria haliotis]PRY19336.1 GntR family transcriptional repressor for pyruvate dehydrogenase complex [Aliiruegeria haliotis]